MNPFGVQSDGALVETGSTSGNGFNNAVVKRETERLLPPAVRCRSVVTIHDCIHLMFPQYLPNRLAPYYARLFMWWAAHRPDDVARPFVT